jgi:hypothetical protein
VGQARLVWLAAQALHRDVALGAKATMVFPPSQRSDRRPAHATAIEAQSTFGNTVSKVAASVAATKVACVE